MDHVAQQMQKQKRSETVYTVSVPTGVPSNLVEKISQAHAKAIITGGTALHLVDDQEPGSIPRSESK